MKIKEIKGLSTEELLQRRKAFGKELFDLNYHRKMGNLEKPALYRALKRKIARVLTVIRERELNDERSKKS